MTINPFSIVHDHPGESIDAGIDWLAFTRVWRSLGPGQPMPKWLRVSACLLDAVQSLGSHSSDAERYDAFDRLLDCDVGYTKVSLIDPLRPLGSLPPGK